MPTLTEAHLLHLLSEVIDPENGINIVDLGLVYAIDLLPDLVAVRMTLTSPACPVGTLLQEEVHARLEDILPEGISCRVELVWNPPWSPERMSAQARQALGW